ncbi:hypothetical protein L1887_56003 [Cichorium endivia]|nr:hypothetical protein L1887_56003 [Cichorium endivia]
MAASTRPHALMTHAVSPALGIRMQPWHIHSRQRETARNRLDMDRRAAQAAIARLSCRCATGESGVGRGTA